MSFRINRVYTRSGDDGHTGLVGGKRVRKDDSRVEAYGDLDELNAIFGCIKDKLNDKTTSLKPLIEQVQNELFDLGAELATPAGDEYEGMWRVSEDEVTRLEKECDKFGEKLPELESFILPGGSELASLLHLARTVCRRVERRVVTLRAESEDNASEQVVKYLNRLSDLCFILARWGLAEEGLETPLWVPANKRNA